MPHSQISEEAIASGYGNNSQAGNYFLLNDTMLYYETYGAGEPLLLLHGNGGSIADFYKQISELAKHFRVIAVDTRAHGKSTDESSGPLTYDLFADDMKVLLDLLQIQKTTVVGWSDGGNTGLILAIKYPDYVNRLAIMGSNLVPSGLETSLLADFESRKTQLQGKTDSDSIKQLRLLSLLINEPQISNTQLQTINAPVLVMVGDQDVIKPEHTEEIRAHINKSELKIFKDANHSAPQEIPEEFNATVIEFLKK
ncbi:MAG: hypothetical protein JWN56_1513 [Sphingobacteriales bacterium]|nr:hypothetical protein [Sphingobacteriales bacterium]